jgi:GNAT superfamily N-acetyltransferase
MPRPDMRNSFLAPRNSHLIERNGETFGLPVTRMDDRRGYENSPHDSRRAGHANLLGGARGWNPGLDDAEAFWAANPDGFVVAEIDGELVGGGAIIAYEKRYGFMGLFLVRPDHRGHGLGNRLWHERDISGRHAPAFFEHGSIGQEAIPLPWWKLKKYAVMP